MRKKSFYFLLCLAMLYCCSLDLPKGINWLSTAADKSNFSIHNNYRAQTAIFEFEFEFDNSTETVDYNNGQSVITVTVSNADPVMIVRNNISYISGKPRCDIKENAYHSIGHLEMDVSIVMTGSRTASQLIKRYKNYIEEKVKSQLLI